MIYETYEQRQRRQARSSEADVYVYDKAPRQLRHQIGLAFLKGIGIDPISNLSKIDFEIENPVANELLQDMDRLCVEEIYSYLQFTGYENIVERVLSALSGINDMAEWLSVVEICCVTVARVACPEGGAAIAALDEINKRFEQHGVGYQFENGQIIRKDSNLVHAEVIKPALRLLTRPEFVKANEAFMLAHKHYRTNDFKDSVTAANRAFESMLKAICELENWKYEKGDRASELVTKVSANGLFTHDFDKGLSTYVAMLKTGLPSIRNDAGGHGEGLAAKAVTADIARFAINLTASNIIFLGDSYAAMKADQRN